VLDKLVTITVSRRPLASVAALGAMSVLASVMLTACDAQAEHRPTAAMAPMSLMSAAPAAASAVVPSPVPSPVSSEPSSRGGLALREYVEDADPSHAAIASYRD
jgi:hypothetical protein